MLPFQLVLIVIHTDTSCNFTVNFTVNAKMKSFGQLPVADIIRNVLHIKSSTTFNKNHNSYEGSSEPTVGFEFPVTIWRSWSKYSHGGYEWSCPANTDKIKRDI